MGLPFESGTEEGGSLPGGNTGVNAERDQFDVCLGAPPICNCDDQVNQTRQRGFVGLRSALVETPPALLNLDPR
jgi:hypothetical protein